MIILLYNLNTSKSSLTKFTPFEIVFNKKPNVGNQKKFVECDKTGEEKEITDSTMAVDEAALDEDAVDDVQATSSESVQPSTSSGNVPASNDIEIEDEEDEYEDDEDEQQEIDSKRSQLNINKEKNAQMMIKKYDHKKNNY